MLNLSSDMESEDTESEVSEDTEVDSEVSEVSGSKVAAMVNDQLMLHLSSDMDSEVTEVDSEISEVSGSKVTASESAKLILKHSSIFFYETKQEIFFKFKMMQ
jgi:hypothetical protein